VGVHGGGGRTGQWLNYHTLRAV